MLKKNYELNLQILQSQNEEYLQDEKFAKLFEAYWISNLKIKNIIELLEI